MSPVNLNKKFEKNVECINGLSYQKYGFGIRNPRSVVQEKSIPDPGSRVKKATDPGSGSVTLLQYTYN
jgi:hypothetical protein